MATINSYLNFNGNTEEAFNFYKSVFGGEFSFIQRFKDTPDGGKLSAGDQEKIMHVALPIGKTAVLMATDSLESMGHKETIGTNFSIAVTPDSEEEAYKIFNGLSAGGNVIVPMVKAPWGALFGMFTDKFGIKWMVNYSDQPMQ